jgi:GNAT superfamily N-acetyltransferase
VITPSQLTVRRAGPADAAAVIAVLDAARSRSVADGYDMWPRGFTAERLEPALGAGRTFLAVDPGGSAVGTITVEREDPLWADLADGVVAGYVHRVAVRERGTGLGAALLDWADGHVVGFGGDRLRLDCIAWDPPLRRYYERAGFVYVDDVALPPLPGVPPPSSGPVALSRYERLTAQR